MQIKPSLKIYLSKSSIPNAGRGIFAATAIRKAEIIEVCPVIPIPQKQVHLMQESLLINYNFSWEKHNTSVAICLGFGSLYNHQYEPNATYKKNFDTLTIEFSALRDIAKGEEITVNYNHGNPDDKTPLWMTDVPASDL